MKGHIFYKMTGSGNDFVIFDNRVTDESWPAARIVAVCHRRNGIGADGVVFISPTKRRAVRMVYYNADGSRVALCGNAALCVTRLAAFLEMADPAHMTLESDAGTMQTRCVGPSHSAELQLPGFQPPQAVDLPRLPGESAGYFGTVGVPHLVIRVEDMTTVDVVSRGRALRHDPAFAPQGTNVNFVSPASGESVGRWRIRTYERGVENETLACGTGSVAAAFALAGAGLADLPLSFETHGGGILTVSGALAEAEREGAWLCGEGRIVFRGVIES